MFGAAMRTTIDVDDDVIQAVLALAAQQHSTLGAVMSALVRKALQPAPAAAAIRNGVPLLALRAPGLPVTPELVARLQAERE